jgi:hypothetical protein
MDVLLKNTLALGMGEFFSASAIIPFRSTWALPVKARMKLSRVKTILIASIMTDKLILFRKRRLVLVLFLMKGKTGSSPFRPAQ